MRKFIGVVLFVSILTACGWGTKPQSVHPAEARPARADLQTPILWPTDAFTPSPGIAGAQFIGQVALENAQVIYYAVTGSTASELRASMDESGPRDPYDNNRVVDAYTDWYISWHWPGYGTDRCDLSAASVTDSITVTLPRWEVPAGVSPALIDKWEAYLQALASHEQRHVDLIVDNYQSIESAIQGATCSTAEAAAQQELDRLRELNAAYDRDTQHGATQGAVFP